MKKTTDDPLNDWEGFFEELQSESPRASVIIASAFLDAQLRLLISKTLVDIPEAEKFLDHELRTFSSRIKAAYCLGLINENIFDDLNVVNNIRNKFAHKMHGYTFDEPEIVCWCESLKLAKMISDASPHFPKTYGALFITGVTQLATWIGISISETENIHKTVPKNPVLGQVVIVNESNKSL
jgi:DNA-binding MltR family transcriptional regulator